MSKPFRLGALMGLWISVVAVVPAGAVPITVTQTQTTPFVSGWSTPLAGKFPATAWSAPWPFTDLTQITQIVMTFDSLDAFFMNGTGRRGGTVWVAIGVLQDNGQRFDIASLNRSIPSVTLTPSSGSFFTTVRALLLDGAIGVTMGSYEYAEGWPGVRDLTLLGDSMLRIQVSGDVPPPPMAVPEPATLALLGMGLLGLTHRLRRPS